MKIEDYITFVLNTEDLPFLRKKLFDVNMRLFKSSELYRNTILRICEYISVLASTTMDGYKKPHGMSGANAGIPFNIIAIVKNRNQESEYVEVMINPTVRAFSGKLIKTITNCGSIRLDAPINVMRHEIVSIQWYDIKGNENFKSFAMREGGTTIQHEIDHNLGVLITDKEVKSEELVA